MLVAGMIDRIVLDAPFLSMHWYKLLAWYAICAGLILKAASIMRDYLRSKR